MHYINTVLKRSSFVVISFNRDVLSFIVVAPVRHKEIRELCEEKSSKPLEPKMRQLPLEINHSLCSHHFLLTGSLSRWRYFFEAQYRLL